jgi:CAAX amino terminal protease family.
MEGDLREKGLRRPTVTQVCILFSLVLFIFIILGFRVQKNEFYSGILITEFGLIMFPALVFLLVFKYDLKDVLRLNKASFLSFFLIICIMLFAIPIAGIFNMANLWLVNSIFGKVIVEQTPVAENFAGLIINILVIGGSAGICEEFLFRGVIQRGLERFGTTRSILLAAFLFSLTHLDFQKIFGTFFLGALIGFIVYRTNSLYGGMLAHFTNNSVAVIISFGVTQFSKLFNGSRFDIAQSQGDLSNLFSMISRMPKAQLLIVVSFYGFILLIFVAIFIALMYAFLGTTRGKAERPSTPRSGKFFGRQLLWLLPGAALVSMIYFMEVMKFTGRTSQFVGFIRAVLGV